MRTALIFMLLLVAGCGYHTPGNSDNWVGEDARLLYVQLFENNTVEPYLENYMTDAVIAELSRSRLIELTEDPALAQVRLTGDVKDFSNDAKSYGSSDRITEYRATMTVAVRLLKNNSSEIIWQTSMQRSEDYLAAVNKNLQLEGQKLAAQQVSQRLAEDLHASMLNNF
jgi:outer membrane lipopolysaccharide assembly protein LptE/RlpB